MAFEVFHHLNKASKRKHGMVSIQLDMGKAYDRLDLNFINHTLININFPKRCTKLIMDCVTTINFFTLINGFPTKYFQTSRGIRQGDPLSPYLFILCADVFSNLIINAKNSNSFKGISIARWAPKITHPFLQMIV